jgi:hypothetical protein
MEIREATPEEEKKFAKLVEEIHTIEDKTTYPPVPKEFRQKILDEFSEYHRSQEAKQIPV